MTRIASFSRLYAVVCVLLLSGFALPAAGQQFAVRGMVVDTLARPASPVPLFPVQLLAADSTIYALAPTDSLGRFNLPVKDAGQYKLRVAGLGFSSFECMVKLSTAAPVADVGVVRIYANDIALREALVAGKASNLTIVKDTFIYSSKAMQLDPGVTLSAMISQMPGVSMDEDGNLVWQGKTVERILVNGKRFFGADLKTALQNLPAEVVDRLKFYDRKSDMAERTGIDDGARTTVMDVQVKSEYRGHWAGSLAGGGGYEGKWLGRLYAGNLSDRLQVGVSANLNNLNGGMKADANGNWTYSGYMSGWTTFRGSNLNLGWTNKDDKRAAGYQEFGGHFDFNHDSGDNRSYTRQENILPGSAQAWWYERSLSQTLSDGLSGSINYSVNLDTLTFLTLSAGINRNRNDVDATTRSAMFSANPTLRFPDAAADPLQLLQSDAVPAAVQALLANSKYQPTRRYATQRTYRAGVSVSRRFGRADMLNVSVSWNRATQRQRQFSFYDLRHYPSGQESRTPRRQHARQNNVQDKVNATVGFDKSVGKQEWLSLNYNWNYQRTDGSREYWNLERLPGWDDLAAWPLTALPEGYRQMAALLLDANSDDQLFKGHAHKVSLTFTSSRDKLDVNLGGWLMAGHDHLDYERQTSLDTLLTRWATTYGFDGRLKYKFTGRTSLSLSGSYSTWVPGIGTRLSIVDTSNPESTVIANPHLRGGSMGRVNLNFSTFFEPQQLSLWAYASSFLMNHATSSIMRYDNATGYYTHQGVNLADLQYDLSGNVGMSMVLDKEKVWAISCSVGFATGNSQSYLGTSFLAPALNTQHRYSLQNSAELTMRRGKLFVSLHAKLDASWYRNDMRRQADESPVQFNYGVNLSYTTPWSMILTTDFSQWSRRRYLDAYLNTNQFIWNISLSQQFLKKKNLTVKVEAVDVLATRENISSINTPTAVGMTERNGFERYVVAHLIYNFNLGK